MFAIEDKYAGRSRAVVIDNRDPHKRGRIRVKHPLLGETVWINYLKSPGHYDVPKIADVVYVECDCGEDTHPFAHGNIVKGTNDNLDVPEAFKRVDPTNRGLYSPGGHLLELDDGIGVVKLGKGLRLTTSGGIKIHAMEGNPAESKVLIEMPNGLKIEADGISDKIFAQVKFGDSMEISAVNGIQLKTPALGGTSISMKAGKMDILSALDGTMGSSTGKLTLNAGTTKLEMTQTTAKLSNTTGAAVNITEGKVALGTPVGETLALIEQALKALKDNASTFVNTSVGPGVLSPAIVTVLTQVLTILGQIKGSV